MALIFFMGLLAFYTYWKLRKRFSDIYRRSRKRPEIWNGLIHFTSMSHFYIPWKRQKTKCFLTFSGGIEIGHWREKGYCLKIYGIIYPWKLQFKVYMEASCSYYSSMIYRSGANVFWEKLILNVFEKIFQKYLRRS